LGNKDILSTLTAISCMILILINASMIEEEATKITIVTIV